MKQCHKRDWNGQALSNLSKTFFFLGWHATSNPFTWDGPLPRCKVHSGGLCGHNGVWSRHQDGPSVVTLWSTTCVKLRAQALWGSMYARCPNNTGFAFVRWYLRWWLAGIGTLQQLQRLAFWTTQLMMNVDNPEHDFLFSFFQIKSHPSPSLQFPPALPKIIMDTPLPQYYTSPTPPHPTEQIWRDS